MNFEIGSFVIGFACGAVIGGVLAIVLLFAFMDRAAERAESKRWGVK